MSFAPGILARGPWPVAAVAARWHEDHFQPSAEATLAANAAIQALRDRDSPSHDGLSARLVGWEQTAHGLDLELQPIRWALRLVEGDASASMSSLLVVRDAQGRWLAGRRAGWLSSWPGRWALGAGGAVDVGETPADTLTRELQEEWSVRAERVQGEALVRLPSQMMMFVGQAWLADGAEVTPDHEHDEYAWWPADPADWPAVADEPLRRMAALLADA